MINTSSAYKNTLYNGHRNFIRKATLYLSDNSEIPITDADICQGGFKFDSATTSSGSFEIGNIIIEKFTILLNNRDDKFSAYDFYNTTLWTYSGLVLDDGSEEWLRKGVFTVKEPDFSDGVITLVCYDNIHKFDIPYTNSKLTYPATRKQIVADICQVCGVTDNTGEFDGYNERVETRPEDKSLSCRDILSFIAQISGLYGRCDNTGGFEFAWYEKIQYEGSGDVSSSDSLDGGNFTDYSSGDTADGGNFTDYSAGDSYDGGTLISSAPSKTGNFHNIYSTASSKPSTDDITITGIKVVTTTVQTVITETKNIDPDTGEVTTETTSTEETIAFEAISGSNEYMLVVTDNPLVNDSNAQAIADHLYSKIGGMTFRPMTLSALADPSMEAGDAMVFTDRKGNSYESYITTLSYTIGQYASITCDAETPLSRKKNSETMSQALKNAIEMENAAERRYTRYAQAVDQLNQIAANALGFYETIDVASDGSKIVYMHDKPKLEDSEIVYKRSIDGFFISRDGGKTYTAGFDSNGNAVVNILSAIGINFDWAYGGTLTLGGDANANGQLVIKDASGNTIVTGNKDGLVISKGTISWENVTGTDDVATKDEIPKNTSDLNNNSGYITFTDVDTKIQKSANDVLTEINNAGYQKVDDVKSAINTAFSEADLMTDEKVTEITKNTVTTSYVDALAITAKAVASDWVYAGDLEAEQIKTGKLTSKDGKSAVIDLDNNSVRFGTSLSYANGKLTLGNDVTISWGQITDTDDIATADDVNSLDFNSRNLALNTSDKWVSQTIENKSNASSVSFTLENMNNRSLKAGDILQVSFDIKFSSGFKATGSGTKRSFLQGDKNQGGTWANISITGGNQQSEIEKIIASSSKSGHINTYIKVTEDMINGTYSGKWLINVRFDYYSGTVYYRNQMVNRGSKEAVWQPAPEDIENEIPTDEYITQITKNTITTAYINALGITAKYINVSDKSSIAGWNISNGKIYGGDSNTKVAVVQKPTANTTYVFAAGGTSHSSYSDCPFRVTKDGKLYASRLYVTGNASTSSGEGFYIYDSMNEKYLLLAECNGGIRFPAFSYTFTGLLRINKLASGIKLDTADVYDLGDGTNHFRTMYARSLRIGCEWYSTDNGAIYTRWKDGSPHDILVRSSDGLTCSVGWAGTSSYKSVTQIRGQTVKYTNSSGTTTLSDMRMKKDFKDLSAWEEFYENSEPCAFKYVDGASGRYHVGFKAQQIQEALESSGLTTQDFAGFIQYDVDPLSEDYHGYETEYGLIYTEFIALNTHMIQQLMKRVALLENEINNLRGMIQ